MVAPPALQNVSAGCVPLTPRGFARDPVWSLQIPISQGETVPGAQQPFAFKQEQGAGWGVCRDDSEASALPTVGFGQTLQREAAVKVCGTSTLWGGTPHHGPKRLDALWCPCLMLLMVRQPHRRQPWPPER